MASEVFTTFEMSQVGGSITFSTSSSDITNLNVGDTWQLTIAGGPKMTPVMLLTNNYAYPPPFQTVGMTDNKGNLKLCGAATQAQQGQIVYSPYYMLFPNTYPGYVDPTAPAGYRNVLVALVAFNVN